MKNVFIMAAVFAALVGCGPKEPKEPAPPSNTQINHLEEMRVRAKDNSELNAQAYKAANPRFTADFNIITRPDTSQTVPCPQGDGWAELSIMRVVDKAVEKTVLMCSTYSLSVGCYRKEDFMKDKNLATQEGACRIDVPNPLPLLRK